MVTFYTHRLDSQSLQILIGLEILSVSRLRPQALVMDLVNLTAQKVCQISDRKLSLTMDTVVSLSRL